MYKIKTVILAVSCLLLSASMFAAKAPGWIVDGTSKDYPKSKYYTAVGEASSKTGAELKAIENIASIFGQSVKSSTKGDKRMSQISNGKGTITESASTLDQSVLRQVDVDSLIGIEIVDFYNDEKNAKWYVFVVMDKPKTAQIYQDLITNNNKVIKTLIAQADSNPSLDSYSRLDFAVSIAKQNETYAKKLSVIDADAAESVVNPNYQAVKVSMKLRELATIIPISVEVSKDPDGRVGKAFEKAIADAGLRTTKGSDEMYKIVCDIHMSSTEIKGKPFCEYTIDAYLQDVMMGENLIPIGFTGREGGNTADQCTSRAMTKIAEKISQTFKTEFNNYLQSLSIN